MREFRLRQDLERHSVGAFQLPLGVEPEGLPEPEQGYTLTYQAGEDDEPDTYAFHVVVSHERIKEVIDAAFGLLPEDVTPVIEIGSRDAYRSVDVYVGEEPVPLDHFLRVWYEFEDIMLEDVCIGGGGNAEDPFVEVFVDSWKGVAIHVPMEWREKVEDLLNKLGLEEVAETWPCGLDQEEPLSKIREVLEIDDEHSPDIDELLLQLREAWDLALNIDPESNVDDAGRELGMTLWHAIVIAEPIEGDPEAGAYVSFWATAASLAEIEEMISDWFDTQDEWAFKSVYSMDRVAFDERPDELGDLPHRRTKATVHMAEVDRWGEDGPGEPPRRRDPDGNLDDRNRPSDRPGDRPSDRPSDRPGDKPKPNQ
ncbi:MAG: hypothetical protein SGJ11_02065 [Phycisphaerae bacterium]|nr:hypothetical protein [Phycisphaerae bacterium]